MKEIMQFSSTKERLKYLSGKFEEIVPKVATPKPVEIKIEMKEDVDVEKVVEEATKKVVEEKKTEEKPKKKKSPAKKKKKGEKDGEVQAK